MTQLTWVADKLEPNTGDPYCDWLCGHGMDFAVGNRMHRQAKSLADFASLIDLDETSGLTDIHQPNSLGQVQPPGRAGRIRYPAPLPQSSLSSSNPIVWNLPAQLAGLSDADKRKIVVVAVIDDGINLANDRFVDAEGFSRIDFAWIQDAPSGGGAKFGREIHAAEIDRVRGLFEDPLEQMKQLKLLESSVPGANSLIRRASHGTHMADLAAGYRTGDPGYEESQLRRMITVQLPFLMTQDTSGVTYAPFLAEGLKFVLDRAETLRNALKIDRLPVVINLSYATSAGPHNGGDRIEGIFNELLPDQHNADGVQAQLVLPAGNRHLERQHAMKVSAGGVTALNLNWRIQPGDQTASFLEIWLPENANPAVKITPPGGNSETVSARSVLHRGDTSNLKTVIAGVTVDTRTSGRDPFRSRRILICVAPTEIYDLDRTAALAGTWKIEISSDMSNGERIEAWIQRDEAPYRFRTNARQSYFADPDYEPYNPVTGRLKEFDNANSVVRRVGTQSAIATGSKPIVVAGYNELLEAPSRYSASGDVSAPGGVYTPTFAAVSDRSNSQPGVLASGTLSGTALAINGTSVAAPQVTRMLADEMATGTSTNFDAAKSVLRANCFAPAKNGGIAAASGRGSRTGYGLLRPTLPRTVAR